MVCSVSTFYDSGPQKQAVTNCMRTVTISSSTDHTAKCTSEPAVALPQEHSCLSVPGSGISSLCCKLTNSRCAPSPVHYCGEVQCYVRAMNRRFRAEIYQAPDGAQRSNKEGINTTEKNSGPRSNTWPLAPSPFQGKSMKVFKKQSEKGIDKAYSCLSPAPCRITSQE